MGFVVALPDGFRSGVYVCGTDGNRALHVWRHPASFADSVRWDLLQGGTRERRLQQVWMTHSLHKLQSDITSCDRALRGELGDEPETYHRTDFTDAAAADRSSGGTAHRSRIARRSRAFIRNAPGDVAALQQMLQEEATHSSPASVTEQWDVVGRVLPTRPRKRAASSPGAAPPPEAAPVPPGPAAPTPSTAQRFAALCEEIQHQGGCTSRTLDLVHSLQQQQVHSAAPCRELLQGFFRPLMLQGGGGLAACSFDALMARPPGSRIATSLPEALQTLEMLLFAQAGCQRMQELVLDKLIPALLPQDQWRGHALSSALSTAERQPSYPPPPLSRRSGTLQFPPAVMAALRATAAEGAATGVGEKRPRSPCDQAERV